ncbi:collagen alpha-3(VI) chain-like [Tupaia chinensis]|uniref:collagen alpha-3(VI) chain-like n=1 Tax=Tupaia chinensis TaxID=246437 RepID=UPI0003C912BC|nr:collagen alpha-3(VI) chain-like [Tupaia chinensis]
MASEFQGEAAEGQGYPKSSFASSVTFLGSKFFSVLAPRLLRSQPALLLPQGPKGNRGDSVDQCALVQSIKDKCPCCYGPLECPVFPTELAFALDTSDGVTQDVFSRMRDVVLKIVGDLTIAESNCPRGARVAVVTYNNEVTTEIRFADSRKKPALLDRIKNLPYSLTSKQQSLETAMSFVARNTFKRVRNGFLMRKVAIFFSNRPTRSLPQLREAVLKLSDAGITPLFLTSQEDRQLINALQVWVLRRIGPASSWVQEGSQHTHALGRLVPLSSR